MSIAGDTQPRVPGYFTKLSQVNPTVTRTTGQTGQVLSITSDQGGNTSPWVTSATNINWNYLPGVMNPVFTTRTYPIGTTQGIAYGDGMFVAVALSGANRVATTSDGINWITRNALEASEWTGVAYGNGLWVAVARTGTNRLYTSPDAVNWTARNTIDAAATWSNVTFGNGRFVAVASSGTNRIAYSDDGINWTGINVGALAFNDVTFGNGVFIAAGGTAALTGNVRLSNDGINWTTPTNTPRGRLQCVGYGNGVFMIFNRDNVNNEFVWRSTDNGNNWTNLGTFQGARSVGASGGKTLAYGNGMWIHTSMAGGQVFYSLDNGLTWIRSTITTGAYAIAFANGLFVATGFTVGTLNEFYSSTNSNFPGPITFGQPITVRNATNSLIMGPGTGSNSASIGGIASANDAIAIRGTVNTGATNGIAIGVSSSVSTSATSAIAIGNTSTAGAAGSLALGQSASATQAAAIAIGPVASAQSVNSIAIGAATVNVNSNGSIAIGSGASVTATNINAISLGLSATASNPGAISIGPVARSEFQGHIVLNNARFSSATDISTGFVPMYMTTTTAAATNLATSDGESATTPTGTLTCTNNSTYIFEVDIVAKSASNAGAAAWNLKFAFDRQGSAATSEISALSKTIMYTRGTTTGWDVTATADTTNGRPNITVTGAAATTIRWVGNVKMTKVAH